MAEEAQYSSDTGSNKRKYEDSTAPLPTRRATGFSGPIRSASPDSGPTPHPSYNSVPPPAVDDVQIQVQQAKQKAQEVASRLLFSASVGGGGAAAVAGTGAGLGGYEAKRSRVDNGSSGFDSYDRDVKSTLNTASSAIPVSYNNYQTISRKIEIPNDRVGVIIGKGGETIKYLQNQSGAKIQVTRDMDADPNAPTRLVELTGTSENIAKAEQLIKEVLAEAESGGSGIVSRRVPTSHPGSEQFVMKVPNNKVGLVIGKGGETIKNMQNRTGARIQVVPLHLPAGDTSAERNLHIEGTSDQIEAAKQLIAEVISENRMRSSGMSGGYSQQGYQSRPPTNWGAPPMQQGGYGYVQPGAYSGAPQYNMNQNQYASYPPQPSSGGYASNWDQSSGAPQSQPTGSYDYYSQQQPASQQQQQGPPGGPTGSADPSGYNYGQPPTAASYAQQGHGYAQDGYGGYSQHAPPQSGYGQPPAYDQQQQGYGAGSAYGNATNPAQDGYGAQSDSSQAAPTPAQPAPTVAGQQGYSSGQPGYGMPPTSQPGYGPGYGAPPAVKPPTSMPLPYGQSQQSPTSAGAYGQAGYPQAPAYGQAPYGVPPAAPQGGYSQQPQYGGYGSSGGYPQAPPYAADGGAASGGAATRGGYDATPPQAQAAAAAAATAPTSTTPSKASPKT